MKIFKVIIIALITVFTFSNAEAQKIVIRKGPRHTRKVVVVKKRVYHHHYRHYPVRHH